MKRGDWNVIRNPWNGFRGLTECLYPENNKKKSAEKFPRTFISRTVSTIPQFFGKGGRASSTRSWSWFPWEVSSCSFLWHSDTGMLSLLRTPSTIRLPRKQLLEERAIESLTSKWLLLERVLLLTLHTYAFTSQGAIRGGFQVPKL